MRHVGRWSCLGFHRHPQTGRLERASEGVYNHSIIGRLVINESRRLIRHPIHSGEKQLVIEMVFFTLAVFFASRKQFPEH